MRGAGEAEQSKDFSGTQGTQVGIQRRVIRIGASEKVIVEQRLEGGELDKQITGERL